jgi:hypothetical protein
LIFFARLANFKVDKDYKNASAAGEIIVNIVVLQFPPRLSESNRVRREFL